MALFESYERRIDKINSVLNSYGIASIEEAEKITKDAGLDVYAQVKKIQPICFENACWAYTVGAAIPLKKGGRRAADAAAAIGEGLQAFCIPGSVADQRKVGLGHGNLGKMLLEEWRKANPNTVFISEVKEITEPLPEDVGSVGVCGATSTPKWLMEEVAVRIRELNASR